MACRISSIVGATQTKIYDLTEASSGERTTIQAVSSTSYLANAVFLLEPSIECDVTNPASQPCRLMHVIALPSCCGSVPAHLCATSAVDIYYNLGGRGICVFLSLQGRHWLG